MSIPRFYLDADSVDSALVRAIRTRGIDVQTAIEVGLRTAHDDQQIAYASATGRIMISSDYGVKDTMIGITRQGGHHPGLLFLPGWRRKEIGAIVFTLRLIEAIHTAQEMVDRVEYIPY